MSDDIWDTEIDCQRINQLITPNNQVTIEKIKKTEKQRTSELQNKELDAGYKKMAAP